MSDVRSRLVRVSCDKTLLWSGWVGDRESMRELLADAVTEIDMLREENARLRTELEKRRKATSTDCGFVESMAGGRRS